MKDIMRKNRAKGFIALYIYIIGILIFYIAMPRNLLFEKADQYIALHTAAIVIIGMLLIHWFYNGLDIFEPGLIIPLIYLQIFVLAPLVWLVTGVEYWYGTNVMKGLVKGTVYFLIGYVFFWVGYWSKKVRARNTSIEENVVYDSPADKEIKTLVFWGRVIYFISIFMSFIYLFTTGRGVRFILSLGQMGNDNFISKTSIVEFLSYFICTSAVAWMVLYVYQRKFRWMLVPMYLLSMQLMFVRGFRYIILIMFTAPIIFKFLKSGKRPKLLTCILIILVVFMIVSFVGLQRSNIRTGEGFTDIDFGSMFQAYMPNVELFFPFYGMVEALPRHHAFTHGMQLLNTFIMLIPRVLWPAKPSLVATKVLEISVSPYAVSAGCAWPNIGEYYSDLGFVGMCICMFLFGWICKWSMLLYVGQRKNEFRLIAYSILYPTFLQIVCRGSTAQNSMLLLFLFGPLGFISWRVKKTRNIENGMYRKEQ